MPKIKRRYDKTQALSVSACSRRWSECERSWTRETIRAAAQQRPDILKPLSNVQGGVRGVWHLLLFDQADYLKYVRVDFVWKLNGANCLFGQIHDNVFGFFLAALTLQIRPGEYMLRQTTNCFLSVIVYDSFSMWVTSLSCCFPIVSDTWLATVLMLQLTGSFWSIELWDEVQISVWT